MKNIIITFLLTIVSFFSFSQEYPKIEVDSTGKKVVIITYEQAQKVDNAFELLKLLEESGTECDNLTLSYIKVIDVLKKRTILLETDISLYKDQITDKDNQIINLKERLKNCESNSSNCDAQISVRDEQISLLNKEVKTLKRKRNIAYGAGILGIIGGILLVLSF